MHSVVLMRQGFKKTEIRLIDELIPAMPTENHAHAAMPRDFVLHRGTKNRQSFSAITNRMVLAPSTWLLISKFVLAMNLPVIPGNLGSRFIPLHPGQMR